MNEQRERADRASLELLYDVSREFAAALDLHAVLHRVLFLSIKNVGAISGSIIVLDDHGQPLESAFQMAGQQYDHANLQLHDTYERGMSGWVARNRQAVLIPDTSQDERWLQRPDDSAEQTGPKSALSVPIQVRDKLVGVITLAHPQPGFFAPDHLDLVKAIADQAGIAIINARLYAESQRQAQVMTALAESAGVITASLNLDDVLQRILEQISQALQVEGASLALIDTEKGELEFRASTFQEPKQIVGMRLAVGEGVSGWVARHGHGVIIHDPGTDQRVLSDIDQRLGVDRRIIMCAPIHLEGQVIGVLEIVNPISDHFDSGDLSFLTGIGSMAGTAIRHAQLFEDLQAAHQRYRDLFDYSIDPILITDWQGNVLEANRQAEIATGFDNDSLRSFSITDLHYLNDEKLGLKFENLKPDETIIYESILHDKEQRETPIQVYVRITRIEGASVIQWIFRDITERKKLDRLREDLSAMIYHDLRSPLANVVSSLDVLDAMFSQDEYSSIKSMVNIAVRSTERIQRLTESLLDISRLEAGQSIINPVAVMPDTLLKDSLDVVAPTAETKDLEIILEVPSVLPPVLVDADMIRRVIVNLTENAIKFTPAEGKIYIGARSDGQYVQMWIRDTGPGISKIDQERIFDKFTRLNLRGGSRGVGLGLAYCRLAVVGHGGQIWVESEPGSGAVFRFTLPIAEDA